jgi:hypothetical protein
MVVPLKCGPLDIASAGLAVFRAYINLRRGITNERIEVVHVRDAGLVEMLKQKFLVAIAHFDHNYSQTPRSTRVQVCYI